MADERAFYDFIASEDTRAMAAVVCPWCDYDTATPHFSTDLDGYTLTVLICNRCGRDL